MNSTLTLTQVVVPSNDSWKQFRRNWWNILRGSFYYILSSPVTCWPVLVARLKYPLLKKSLHHPVQTPEGLTLKANHELLTYCQEFVEQNLFHMEFALDLEDQKAPVVVDVGANTGFFSHWIKGFNRHALCLCFEPFPMFFRRLCEMSKGFICFNKAVSDRIGTTNLYTQRLISLEGKGASIEVATITLDEVPELQQCERIFCLKIDTDGSNSRVLSGAKETLKKTKWLLIEDEVGVTTFIPNYFKKVARTSPDDLIYKNENNTNSGS